MRHEPGIAVEAEASRQAAAIDSILVSKREAELRISDEPREPKRAGDHAQSPA